MVTNGAIKTDRNLLLLLLNFLTKGCNIYHCFYGDCVRQELSRSDPSESSDGSREFLFVKSESEVLFFRMKFLRFRSIFVFSWAPLLAKQSEAWECKVSPLYPTV